MKVVFAGGGTGGHIFPAVAVIEALRGSVDRVDPLFVLGGRRGGKMLDRAGVPWRSIPMRGMPRRNRLALPLFYGRFLLSLVVSLGILLRRRPDSVVAVGGYASTPVALAALLLRLPLFAAEQNTVPGVATRWNARFAHKVFLSYEESRAGLAARGECVITGNPVRPSILRGDRERALERWGLDPDRLTVLVVGGSQGARTMNRIVREAIERWDSGDGVQVLFQTGESDYEEIRESCSRVKPLLRPVPFLTEMGDAYGVADLVVCRAGASTLAEITALGLPSILIPCPGATDRHQSRNAQVLADHGAALWWEQKDLTAEKLLGAMRELLADGKRRREMGRRAKELGCPDAAERIAGEILAAAGKGSVIARGGEKERETAESGEVR